MDHRTRRLKAMNRNRCLFSGQIIGNKPAVIEKYVVSYARKQGYLVSRFKILSMFFLSLFFFLVFLPLVSSVNSDGMLFYVDMDSSIVAIVLGILFVIAILLFVFRKFLFSASLFVLMGFTLLFSGFNFLISLIFIILGILIVFGGGKL